MDKSTPEQAQKLARRILDLSWLPVDARKEVAKLAENYVKASAEVARLRASMLNKVGDDLCWIYASNAKIPPRAEFLESCSRYHAQIAAERGELEGCRTIAQLEVENERLREACANAYQFCAAGGANSDLLDNLDACASGEEPPHDWTTIKGEWKFGECGHESFTGCERCLIEARAEVAKLRKEQSL